MAMVGPIKYGFQVAKATLRSQQIGYYVTRYAVAEGLASIGIEVGKRGLSVVSGTKSSSVRLDAVYGKNLAKALVKLGPTFIKLGQMLALRPDLVGESVAEELRVLFDQVPPIPFRQVRKILKQELGPDTLRVRFKSIDPLPLASASLAQTHTAELKDGSPVILKVQKPGVARLVKLDLMILGGLAKSLSLPLAHLNLKQMYEDFKTATLREVDYREEARNIDKFKKNYRKFFVDSDVAFPSYFPELTTDRVIALEPMRGKKVAELKKGSTVARTAASKGLTAVLEQIFEHGFFHADPHAGNLFFMEDQGQIGFIDLGLVGQLQIEDKRKFLKVLLAVLKRDKKQLAASLFQLGIPGKKTKMDKFEADVNKLLDEVRAKGVDNVKLHTLVNDLLKVTRKNSITVPNRYIMMIRTFLIIEGVAKSLDPNISLFRIAPPIVAKSLLKSYSPFRIFRKF